MGVKFTNNAKTTLSASVSTSATSVSVASSSGFPSLSGSDYFYATMVQQSDDTALEIVKVTAVSGTTWTVSRAQDNTSARAFASGDKIELRASAGVFIDLFAEKAPLANPTFTGNITIGNAEISETELEILDGATVTTDELNKLDGTTATAASLTYGKDLYDTGVTAAEFDYLDGVTANIQTQISAKMSEPSGFARGSIIIGDSSGNPANLAAGANGYVLKSDGTDISWAEDEKTTTTNFVKNAFTGDNSTTAFTLSQSPNSEDNLIVFIEGVFQNQGDYSLSGTTLTFDVAPATGRKIVAYHVKAAVSGANLNHDQFTASGSAAFTLSITPINENNTQVFIDGVYQQKTDYSVSGTTLTFDTAPASGAIVEVMTFTQTEINVPTTGSVVTASIANDVNLNGNPTTTTQSAGNNSTRIATTAFVETAVSNLIDSAPGTMNTLNEIAAALGDDPTFTTTVNNAIATKLPLSGGTMTGNIAHASDFTIDVGGDISLDADGDNINFKAGGVDIASFAMSPTSSSLELDALGDLTLDVAGDIILDADGGDITFKDGGTEIAHLSNTSSDFIVTSAVNDKDIIFKGVDNSSVITALTLDMSDAGKATFNSSVVSGGSVQAQLAGFFITENTTNAFSISSNGANGLLKIRDEYNSVDRLTIQNDGKVQIPDNAVLQLGNSQDLNLFHDGSDSYIRDTGTGNLLIQYSDLYFSKDGGSSHSVVFRSTGKVGIGGVTSPQQALHIFQTEGGVGAKHATIRLGGYSTVGAEIAAYRIDGNSNNQGLIFSANDATDGTIDVFQLDNIGQGYLTGSQPALFVTDTTAGGGAGNGGQINFRARHASASDGFREMGKVIGVKANSTGGDTHGYLAFYSNQGAASSTEGARLTEDGDFIVGDTVYPTTSTSSFGAAAGGTISTSRAATNLQTHYFMQNPNGTVGSIKTTGSSTQFNTSSDYRLKENVSYSWNATTELLKLKPAKFNFKADPKTTIEGFLAHEVEDIVPIAVSGTKDEVYSEEDEKNKEGKKGDPKYQSIDQSKLVPLLVKTIQELEARIKTLEDA